VWTFGAPRLDDDDRAFDPTREDAPGGVSPLGEASVAATATEERPLPTWEEWGTSKAAVANLHAAMALIDELEPPASAAGREFVSAPVIRPPSEARLPAVFDKATVHGRLMLAQRLVYACRRANARSQACYGFRVAPEVTTNLTPIGQTRILESVDAQLVVGERVAARRSSLFDETRGPPGRIVSADPCRSQAPPRRSSFALTGSARAA
jgi:hypothetical protein